MLDLIVCSTTLHKQVRNCFVASDGADSDITPLKYKEKASLNTGEIDWRKICKEDEQRKLNK